MSMRPFSNSGSDGDGDDEKVYRVAELNRAVRFALEDGWPDVRVEGELSDVNRPPSGHYYFTLNDEEQTAQLRGVMFRGDARRARADLEDGARVRMRGSLSLFEPRGAFQLIARQALPAGLGDLHKQFERTRKLLAAEGLLDAERKRPLPGFPRTVGVVTSSSGAALHDIIRVSSERCPVRIVVSHCLVQGAEAPASIVSALQAIQRLPALDVVIVGRGGGSAEDLFAFNDEQVARAIAACTVPIVSAVGHEVDNTNADLVADVRAATPSNAAELVVPDRDALVTELSSLDRALQRNMEVFMGRLRQKLDRNTHKLRDPRDVLSSVRSSLQSLQGRLSQAMHRLLTQQRSTLQSLSLRLSRTDPRLRVANDRARLESLTARLHACAGPLLSERRARLSELTSRIQALSPLAVLSRGYAIALHEPSGKALLRATDAKNGDRITIRLHDGQLKTRVE
jgi:exodeoxyribonuclease VII large subunit